MKKVYVLFIIGLAMVVAFVGWRKYGATPEKHYVIGVLNYAVAAELFFFHQ